MSLEVWGDKSPGAARGSETLLYQDLTRIRDKFDTWLKDATTRREFWSPEDEAKAVEISDAFDVLREMMDVKF